jgi:hypothetical protein
MSESPEWRVRQDAIDVAHEEIKKMLVSVFGYEYPPDRDRVNVMMEDLVKSKLVQDVFTAGYQNGYTAPPKYQR